MFGWDLRALPYIIGALVAGCVVGWFAHELNDYLAKRGP